MTAQTAASAAYIVAALLFILALAGLSRHETARFGNTFGIAGMAIALVATLVLAISGGFTALQVGLLIGAMVIGAAIGLYRAARVPMTGMPELIALFHSFVGLAAVLVGWNGYLEVEAGEIPEAAAGSTLRCWASTTPRWSSACSSARSRSPGRSSPGASCRRGSSPRRWCCRARTS